MSPNAVPTAPMITPSATKIFITEGTPAPIDFSTAISRVFSSTSMMSVATMMKLATSTMKPRMTAITTFSICSAEKRLRLSSPQSFARNGQPPSANDDPAHHRARGVHVVDLAARAR